MNTIYKWWLLSCEGGCVRDVALLCCVCVCLRPLHILFLQTNICFAFAADSWLVVALFLHVCLRRRARNVVGDGSALVIVIPELVSTWVADAGVVMGCEAGRE